MEKDLVEVNRAKAEFDKSSYPAVCEIGRISEEMIAMSDGMRLRAVVYLPDSGDFFLQYTT